MSTTAFDEINTLLQDKLFQVIGSTPRSIADSLKAVDFNGKVNEGAQLFAVSIFAAAVNKSTLETFLADPRFAAIRPLINAALSIQGRSNMTAMTLLGHCFLTTDEATKVQFAEEFRKKMGQKNLWDGELTAGSLSDKQRNILKEKKRLTNFDEAAALANGFLKITGLKTGPLVNIEAEMFGPGVTSHNSTSLGQSMPIRSPPRFPLSTRGSSSSIGTTKFNISNSSVVDIPNDVLEYRTSVLGQSSSDITASIESRGLESFITRTRTLMVNDPDGSRARAASAVGS
jgi:hypothetical protein